jgi:hypothetical protein
VFVTAGSKLEQASPRQRLPPPADEYLVEGQSPAAANVSSPRSPTRNRTGWRWAPGCGPACGLEDCDEVVGQAQESKYRPANCVPLPGGVAVKAQPLLS